MRSLSRRLHAGIFAMVAAIASAPSAQGLEPIRVIGRNAALEPVTVPSAAPETAMLRWLNGETAAGELVDATAAEMRWKTPLFEEPLALAWHALRRIDYPLAPVATADPFSFVLRNGSHLFGDLTAISADEVAIRSARHGEVRLKRAEVLSARRLRGGSVVFSGPAGEAGWTLPSDAKSGKGSRMPVPVIPGLEPLPGAGGSGSSARRAIVSPLTTGPGGTLALPYWNTQANLDLAVPEQVEIEFRLRSSKRPDFQLALSGAAKQRVRIETWDDELVVAAGARFQKIRKLADDERAVGLRLRWDRKAGKCVVSTASGELLAELQTAEDPASTGAGLGLHNKGRDLTLDFLRVRDAAGAEPARFDSEQPRVELANGRVIEGEIAGVSAGAITVRSRGEGSEQSVPPADVSAVIFSADLPQVRAPEATLAFADGTLLFGRIRAIEHGSTSLETPFAAEPFPARIDALRQLLLAVPKPAGAAPEPPLAELDRIVVRQATLHGRLVGAGEPWPRWLPVGGTRAVAPAKDSPLEITRAFPPETDPPNAAALFYTAAGDVLPGALRALDRNTVEIESDLVGVAKLSPAELDAIHFGAASRFSVKGFADPAWRIVTGDEKSVRRTENTLAMDEGTALAHPIAMQAGEIRFRFDSTNFCTLRMGLFSAGTDGKKATNLMLMRMGDRVSVGIEAAEGQFDDQAQTRLSSSEPVAVKIIIQEKSVEVHLNEALTRRFPIEPEKRAGAGLILEPASMWGNSVQPIALSNFSTATPPGRSWMPDIHPETRAQTLTIPRFRKDDPPRHVLLAANGDLLRGEIAAITSTHFGFRSGLETLRVPRDRVKAAICLKKPEAAPSGPPVEKGPGAAILDRRIARRGSFRNTALAALVRVLQQEAPELKVKLPPPDETHRASIQFTGLSIGRALDQICAKLGLRHRMDAAGVVVIEGGPGTPPDMVERVYWLKADALPAGAPAQEALVKKGILFPPGATAQWLPGARQLAVTNTAVNHAKIAAIWPSEEGVGAVTLTHWFQLSNGGQVGVHAEKFEEAFVAGRHPIYGLCRIPVAQIVTVRTSRPAPAPATHAFAEWRLTFAPEPVLPETGGQSSPLLGKPAKTFKLPLLGGGDFDLGQMKGRVIVLDFWATWCGPCIQSMPGLLEMMSTFPADRVALIGLNQGEPADQVKLFLETRQWPLTVALDADQTVARQYGVEGIPHTVIVGPDGNVAWVKSGASPGEASEMAEVVKRLLGTP